MNLKTRVVNAKDRTLSHVTRHRGKYCSALTAAVFLKMEVARAEQWNEFLRENDLFDKFYEFDEV